MGTCSPDVWLNTGCGSIPIGDDMQKISYECGSETTVDSVGTADVLSFPRKTALLNPGCIVCGSENAHGLRINFKPTDEGVSASWSPTEDWASFQGTIHGGIVSTVLDEAMSKAVMGMDWEAFTVELRIRFRHVVRPGDLYAARAWVINKRRRRIQAEATLTSASGVEHAHAWATFLQVQGTE
jgi:acyl-coenzyme A thioesterase PaaI-like protein